MVKNILEAIGNTPLMALGASVPKDGAPIFAKLEFFNPGGSTKDRICLHMIESAEARGDLKPGGTIIEPTSGNTGIGLAIVAAVKKHRLILVMPENYSKERRYMMQELGAELVLTSSEDEMPGAIERAQQLAGEIPGSLVLKQFSNPDNPETHRLHTAPEIFADLPAKKIHAFVIGVGTGGTLTGVGSELKKQNPLARVIAVEPEEAPVLSGGSPGVHPIQGIGPGFIPPILDRELIDEIVTVNGQEAYETAKQLSKSEGILAGISSGAALAASIKVAKKLGKDKNVLTVFPDKGERYFSIEKYFKTE